MSDLTPRDISENSQAQEAKELFAHRNPPTRIVVEDDRTGMSVETLKSAFLDNLAYLQGADLSFATRHDLYMALSYTVRDRLIHRWIKTIKTYQAQDVKQVFYLSAEFLMGRQLQNNLLNTSLWKPSKEALKEIGIELRDLLGEEAEPGLGNGGLGRLAACFLDSMATLQIPAHGYGIRYEFGIFQQAIQNGWQVERPDEWLTLGNPWEIHRPEHSVEVEFGGHTEQYIAENGEARTKWVPLRTVIGAPYDTMVPGYSTCTVNTLRLWRARASKEFDFHVFNAGDYTRAVEEKTFSENISKVLYPNDHTPQGRELRLRQQYFFVSCSIQDIIRIYLRNHNNLDNFHLKTAIQLNDTHPSIGVAELMRLLVDRFGYSWDEAWEKTVATMGYTNHTLLPEALEKWPVHMFEKILPRHLEIIYKINDLFLKKVGEKFPGEPDRLARMSLIEEGTEKKVRMANLATIGSHAINGVAALHTRLVKEELLRDFAELWPERFSNKTNGVTPRRWMMLCNPKLTYLITEKIGKGWLKDLSRLKQLENWAKDRNFRETWDIFKTENKQDLADYIRSSNGITVDATSLFDVQVKRLHEYKRQLLNVLYVITLFNRLKANPKQNILPRTFIFGAKAAPGYHMAKLIIKLINSVAEVVNNDPDVAGRIKVVFLSNFCVSLGEMVYPAADLSEQISMAGKEASGTGNMKFALNGALTIGTLDGANVEIREAVGAENFFLFGNTVEDINKIRSAGYLSMEYYRSNVELKAVMDAIASGIFSNGDTELFKPIVDSLLYQDQYMLFADYQSYLDMQEQVSRVYQDRDRWIEMSILNVARMGYFSSDRTIDEYSKEIWGVHPVDIVLDEKGCHGRSG